MLRQIELDKPFPLGNPEIERLCKELRAATNRRDIHPFTMNIYGALLIDIASGRGLTTLSKHLCDMFLCEPYFCAEGLSRFTELPRALTVEKLSVALDREINAIRRFGRFRGMVIVDVSAVSRPDDALFQQFVVYASSYANDIVFVFRTDSTKPGQFDAVQRQLFNCFLVRGAKIVERDNRHYYQKVMDEFKANGVRCPIEFEDAVYKLVDVVAEGQSFEGFKTVTLLAKELVACVQRQGAVALNLEAIGDYISSATYSARAQSYRCSKRIGF